MALENVRYYEHGEWRPITIEEADQLYDDSVSVDSHAFMCYGCYHYVTFKKNYYRTDGVFVRSQFAHSRGDEEKQCEYRTSLSADGRQAYLCSTLSMPMRLRIDGLHVRIEIGLLPLTIEEIKLRIQGILRLLVKRLGEDDGLGGVVEGVVLSHSGVLPFCSCLFCFCVSGVPFLTL